MVLSGVPRKKSPVTPPGFDPGTFRLVAHCLNHYATPGPYICIKFRIFSNTDSSYPGKLTALVPKQYTWKSQTQAYTPDFILNINTLS